MHTTIHIPDIECDSCKRLIGKMLGSRSDISSYKIGTDTVELEHEESLDAADLIKKVHSLGFRCSLSPFDRKTYKERYHDFKENKSKYKLEMRGVKYFIGIFLLLFVLEAVAYVGFLNQIDNFLARYAWWLLYLNVSVVSLGFAIWHLYSYKAKVTCMVGMMIGMTIGMQSGLMIGAVLGATNGFFVGAMTGMLLGVLVGSIAGNCCGIMGVMEGMMAGVMGGTMGAMITVMMLSDHILLFMPVYIIINVGILGGLSYMLYEEVVEHRPNIVQRNIDFVTSASMCIIVVFILGIIMIYGPKSFLVG